MFKKILSKTKEFFNDNTRLAVFIFFILEFLVSSCIVGFTRYDGEYFIAKTTEMSLWDFSVMRYNTWSSRNIIEALSAIVLRWPTIIWAFVNGIMDALIAYLIIKLFVKKDDKKTIWISIAFMLLYPMHELSSVGWGVGTINYTWVLAMLLLSVVPIRKKFDGEKIKKWMYPIYTLALIYACNNEQACVVALLIYLTFNIIYSINNPKKSNKFMKIQFIISIICLIVIATCPGNNVRKIDETETYYVDYSELSLLDKSTLGIVSTVKNLILDKNIVFLAFAILIAYYVCKNYNIWYYKVISLIPVLSSALLGFGQETILKAFPHTGIYIDSFKNTKLLLFTESYLDLVNYVPIIFSLIIIGSIVLSLLIIFKKLNNNSALAIFLIGFASRAMMGFSPTIFASCERTFLFFDFALIIDCILIWQEMNKNKDKQNAKSMEILEIFYYFLAIFQYIDLLLFVLVNK